MSVTIITPSFNKALYVIDAIKSVISQTYCDWTYYIVENSTDKITRDTIKEYLKTISDERIKYLEVNFSQTFREKIFVPALLCNALFVLADKKYMFYLSDDDILHELCLGSMVQYLDENQDAGACYCRAERLRLTEKNKKDIWEKVEEFPFGQVFDENIKPDCVIDGGQVMCRRSIIEDIIAKQELINLFFIPNIKGVVSHNDGIFLNKLTDYTKIVPCTYNSDKVLLTNRRTELSNISRRKSD